MGLGVWGAVVSLCRFGAFVGLRGLGVFSRAGCSYGLRTVYRMVYRTVCRKPLSGLTAQIFRSKSSGFSALGCYRDYLEGWLNVPSPGAAVLAFSLMAGLGAGKRCKQRRRSIWGCPVSIHGFGVLVRLRGLERVLVVFGG